MRELLLEISYKCNFRYIHCSSIRCEGKIKVDDIPKLVDLDEIDMVRLIGDDNKDMIETRLRKILSNDMNEKSTRLFSISNVVTL